MAEAIRKSSGAPQAGGETMHNPTDGRPGMDPNRDRIAEAAYQIWQEQGCPEGVAEQNWIEAERRVNDGEGRQSV